MADILKERGWFWWSDLKLPATQFAPENYIGGTLTISGDGGSLIELDGVLPSTEGPYSAISFDEIAPEKSISGLLRSGKYLMAFSLNRAGGQFSSNRISFENFKALTCLISREYIPSKTPITAINFDLRGYEEWLQLDRTVINRNRQNTNIKLRNVIKFQYRHNDYKMRLSKFYTINNSDVFGYGNTDIINNLELQISKENLIDITEATRKYKQIQDFLIMLTGSEYQARWPDIKIKKGPICKMYTFRDISLKNPPNVRDVIVSFPEIKSDFAKILYKWIFNTENIGPGYYLYLSTRRGRDTYTEQNFISLIWGLESLHRTTIENRKSQTTENRLNRILSDIKNEDDRMWLEKRTKNFSEMSLENRIFDLFSTIPTMISRQDLRALCNKIAAIRNSLSHHGKVQFLPSEINDNSDIIVINEILRYLYHSKLLLDIGIPRNILGRWLHEHKDSYHFKRLLAQLGITSFES